MPTLPATFLQLKAAFVLRDCSFRKAIAKPLNTSSQYVGRVLKAHWQRPDVKTTSELQRQILAATEAFLLSHQCNGLSALTQDVETPDICADKETIQS